MAWNSKDIRSDLEVLEKMYNREENISSLEYLSSLISSLYDVITELEYTDIYESEKVEYSSLISSISNYNMYYPFIREYYNIASYYENTLDSFKSDKKKYKLKRSDIFNLIDEFYKSVGGIIYDTYKETVKNSNINYLKNSSVECGNVFSIPLLNKHYINIASNDSNRDKLITLTHEFGHSVISDIDKYRYNNFSEFVEIESLFFELLSYDFYRKSLNDDYFFELEKSNINYYSMLSKNVLNTRDIVLDIFNDESLDREGAQKAFLEIVNGDLGDEITLCLSLDCRYIVSYITAIELYDIYKHDKDKAIKKLLDITSNSGDSEYARIVNNVKPNKSLVKYIKRFI